METYGIVISAISAIGVVFAIVFSAVSHSRASKKETGDAASQQAAMLVQIGTIQSGIDEIKKQIKENNSTTAELRLDLTKISIDLEHNKSDLQTAFRKIDALSAKIDAFDKKTAG